jgi:hypothetical protein
MLAVVLTAKAVGDGISQLDIARVQTVTGQILDSQASAKVHVYPKTAFPGTERVYDVNATGGNYSIPIKLFPGLNLIEAATTTGTRISRANLKVAAPALRVELIAGPYIGYTVWVLNYHLSNPQEGSLPSTYYDGNGYYVENVVFPAALAGIYNVVLSSSCYYYPPPSPETATVNIYLDEKQIYSGTRLLSMTDWDYNWCAPWSVASVVIHSTGESGGYLVDENGYRDITEQGALVGVPPYWANYLITEFTGNGGTEPIYLEVGKSAQFKVKGIMNYGIDNEQTDQDIIWCFYPMTISGTNVAIIDDLGVLTALSPGHVQVCGWDPIVGYSSPIDVYVPKVDTIEASSPIADNSSQFFEGRKTIFSDPCVTNNPGQALVVFQKDARDANFVIQDFDVTLNAHVIPPSVTAGQLSEAWAKVDGPNSGSLNRTDTFEVEYQNPKTGGVYKIEFDLGLPGYAKSGAIIELPLGGPDVTSYYLSEEQRYNNWLTSMKTRVHGVTSDDFVRGSLILAYFTKTVANMHHTQQTFEAGHSPCKVYCPATVTISGYVFQKVHIGNFLFSYLAARAGITFGTTRFGANLANHLADKVPDTLEDQASYTAGYAHGQSPSTDFKTILESRDINAMQVEQAKRGWPSTDTATGGTYPTWGATHAGLTTPD